MIYTVTKINIHATDDPIAINDKVYGVESRAWNLITLIQSNEQAILNYIYDNFDEDVIYKLD